MTTFDQSRSAELPLLKTKITVPLIHADYLHRPRLTEQIDLGVQGPLTVLAAPAGFGKTNLLVEWIKSSSLPACWLAVDSNDNDPGRFFVYLIAALQTIEPRLGVDALDFLQSARGIGWEVGFTMLVNDISALKKEIVLILDDFQSLEEKSILDAIGFFIKHQPHNMHLIIACRSEPSIELGLLRAKGYVIDLGMNDLRFNGEEVRQYFQQVMKLHLEPDTIRLLDERTDGWITGLQMAAISLQHKVDPVDFLENLQGPAHYLVDFLAEEVLDRQSEDIRQFLLRSSVLDTLTGPLCEAVVNPDAQPGYGKVTLDHLEHAKLFITALDEKHEWFRFHNLFRDFLRHIHSEINPGEIPILKKRAAIWFEKNSSLNEAVKYALESNDEEWTADLLERNLEKMVKTGEIFYLTRWIGKLPEELKHRHPVLALTYAWGEIAAYHIDNAAYWVDELQNILDRMEEQKPSTSGKLSVNQKLDQGNLWNFRGGVMICKSTLALLNGDMNQAAEFSRQAAKLLGEENPFIHSLVNLEESLYYILSGDTRKAVDSLHHTIRIARHANNLLVLIIATCQLAEMQAMQGQLSQAWVTLQKAQYMAIGPDGKALPLAGLADVGFGEILLERNELTEADTYLKRGVDTSGTLWWLSNLDGMISIAHLRQVQGDIPGSEKIIDGASRLALSSESSQWDDTIVSAIAVRMALRREDLHYAEHWWHKGTFPNFLAPIPLEDYPYHIYEYLVLTQVRLLIMLGKEQENKDYLHQSLDILDSLMLEARQFQRVTSQLEIQILQAVAYLTLGDVQRAGSVFSAALAQGEPEGYRRIFLDGGKPVARLLEYCRAEKSEKDFDLPSIGYIDGLLESIGKEDGKWEIPQISSSETKKVVGTVAEDEIPVSLSAREIEVLTLIAEGKSNQEISTQLYLALNTVKRHAYNIYAKLGVKKRTQAVSKARHLGLLQ